MDLSALVSGRITFGSPKKQFYLTTTSSQLAAAAPFQTLWMGVDNVRQVEIVTVNGDVVIANECQNHDLFFAVRGGGGGTYGVITNVTYMAIEKHEVQVCRSSGVRNALNVDQCLGFQRQPHKTSDRRIPLVLKHRHRQRIALG